MLDHVFPGPLGTISRELAYLDAQGGRPGGFAGTRLDRNVRLYRRGACLSSAQAQAANQRPPSDQLRHAGSRPSAPPARGRKRTLGPTETSC